MIWKGIRTQSVWEYTIPPLLAKFKPPVWRFFIVSFYLYYDLGPVVKPRDDIENKNTARLGGGGVILTIFQFACRAVGNKNHVLFVLWRCIVYVVFV